MRLRASPHSTDLLDGLSHWLPMLATWTCLPQVKHVESGIAADEY
jgi:hypothetical protein